MHLARLSSIVAVLAPMLQLASAQVEAPVWVGAKLNESGHVTVDGRQVPYQIRHLPVSSFPDLPAAVQAELVRRGCLIPQTYEAHHPENVVRGSFERPGSQDWAALCSAGGAVSLLVFFSSAPDKPSTLASAPETNRLQVHDLTGVLGFDWNIDKATPDEVREAQIGMEPRPPRIDHDAVTESTADRKTIYHFWAKSAWTVLNTGQ
jgi:hypothetical protein